MVTYMKMDLSLTHPSLYHLTITIRSEIFYIILYLSSFVLKLSSVIKLSNQHLKEDVLHQIFLEY